MPTAIDYKFNFKSRKIVDESGKEIGRTKKQDSVVASLAIPTADEITVALSQENSPIAQMIRDSVTRIIVDAAREQFDELIESFGGDDSKVVTAGHLDHSRLTLEYIASLPPSTRSSSALTEEDFEIFFTDYLGVMVQATGKEERRIKAHIDIFRKPQRVKAKKDVLSYMVEHLDIYLTASANVEETGECATRIRNKLEKWLNEPEKAIGRDEL